MAENTKAEQALIAYAKARNDVARLSKLIGEALLYSFESQPKGEDIDWLANAYEMQQGPADHGHGWVKTYTHHDNDVEGYLGEHCQHALRAHLLIQERKQARKQLGIAKRRLTVIANGLLAGVHEGSA